MGVWAGLLLVALYVLCTGLGGYLFFLRALEQAFGFLPFCLVSFYQIYNKNLRTCEIDENDSFWRQKWLPFHPYHHYSAPAYPVRYIINSNWY